MQKSSARLVWKNDKVQQAFLLAPGGVATIGREPDNDIIIPLASISRNHARIEWIGNSFVLSDLGSANGTFVNGQRVGRVPWILQDGDRIHLHVFRLQFELVDRPVEITEQPKDQKPSTDQLQPKNLPQTSILKNPSTVGDESTFFSQVIGPDHQPMTRPHRLVAVTGLDSGRTYNLTLPTMTIGYAGLGATWDIQLNDPSVSQPHARIEKRGTVYTLIDMGSKKGTRLNDRPVTSPAFLREGDVIMLGEARLVYRGEEV